MQHELGRFGDKYGIGKGCTGSLDELQINWDPVWARGGWQSCENHDIETQLHSVLHWKASTLGSSLGGKLHLVPYWGNARGNCGQGGVWISWINVGCSSLWVKIRKSFLWEINFLCERNEGQVYLKKLNEGFLKVGGMAIHSQTDFLLHAKICTFWRILH